MSSAGKCPRALSAELLGMTAEANPPWLEKAAEEGNWHEGRIKEELKNEGIAITMEQQEVKLDYPSFTLVGHIDGKAFDIVEEFWVIWRILKLLEIKTMSQFEFDRWMKGGFKAFPNYAAQITCYMEATELEECLYIVKNRSSGYEDRRTLTHQPDCMDRIVSRLTDTANHVLGKELASGEFDPQSIECRRCDYKKLCIPEPKELTEVEEALLANVVEDWREGKYLTAKGQAMIDNAKDVFEQHTRATNIFKWSFNRLAIQLVHYNESITYPKAKLLEKFTEEQLKSASQVKKAFDQLRISDMEKEK